MRCNYMPDGAECGAELVTYRGKSVRGAELWTCAAGHKRCIVVTDGHAHQYTTHAATGRKRRQVAVTMTDDEMAFIAAQGYTKQGWVNHHLTLDRVAGHVL